MSGVPARVGSSSGELVVGAGRDQVQWDPVTVAGHGAFGALFDRFVDGTIGELPADNPVLGVEPDPQQLGAWPAWPTRSGDGGWCGPSSRAGEAFVAAAVHQRGDHIV
jgi:hypothetical protein